MRRTGIVVTLLSTLILGGCATRQVGKPPDAPPQGVTETRQVAPTYSIAEVGDGRVVTPYPGPRAGYDVTVGRHVFRITFSKDVDRASVEAAVRGILERMSSGFAAPVSVPKPSFEWRDDRTVEVAVDLDAGPNDGRFFEGARNYLISPDGASFKDGQKIALDAGLWLTARAPVTVYAVRAWPGGVGSDQVGATGRAVMTLDPGRPVASVFGDGQALLALEKESDAAIGDSGDAPPLFVPWLYPGDGKPASLYAQTRYAIDLGFLTDGRVWTARMREMAIIGTEARPAPPITIGVGTELIFDALAVSGNGGTVAYLMRARGETARGDKEQAKLDLIIDRPAIYGSDAVAIGRDRVAAVMRMPAMADFYGPPIGMALDHDGDTLIFNDLSVRVHPLVVMDLKTRARRTIAAPESFPGIAPVEGYPIRGFAGNLAISVDGTKGAGLVTGVPVVVDLESGAVRAIKLPARIRLDERRRPFSSSFMFSPDGQTLAFPVIAGRTEAEEEARVAVYDLASGAVTDRGPGKLVGWSTDGSSVFVVRPAK